MSNRVNHCKCGDSKAIGKLMCRITIADRNFMENLEENEVPID